MRTYTDAAVIAEFKRSKAWLVPTMVAPHAALAQARAGARSAATLAKAEETVAVHNENIAEGDPRRRPHRLRHRLRCLRPWQEREGVRAARQGRHDARGRHPRSHIDAATLLDRASRIGSLEPGKDADIIAVAASPLDEVTVLERVRFVMRQGVIHTLDGARQAFPPR